MPLLLHNALAMLVARLAPPAFSFAINVAIARVYGADALGTYVYLLSLLLVFQAIAGAGMPFLVTRELAVRPDETVDLVRAARTVGCASGVIAAIGFFVLAWCSSDGGTALAAAALAPSLLASGWIAVQEAYFIARHEHHAVTAVAIAENAVKLALAGLALLAGGGLVAVFLAIASARWCALVVGQKLMDEPVRTGWRPDWRRALPLARALPPFAAMIALAMLFFRIDILVLGVLDGGHDTGVYGAALTLYSVALLLPESAMAAIYPRLATSFRSGGREAALATLLTAKLLAIGLVPLALGMIDLAQPLLHLVYGPPFEDSAPALRLLVASLPIQGMNIALAQALQASGHQREMLAVAGFGTALHLVVTCAFVATLGWLGAPLAVLLSSSVVALSSAWLFHRRVGTIQVDVGTWIGLSAVAVPIALVLVAPPELERAATAAGVAWLGLALVARRMFRRSEVDEIARLIRSGLLEVGVS